MDVQAVPTKLVLDDILINESLQSQSIAVVKGAVNSTISPQRAPGQLGATIPTSLQYSITASGPSQGRCRFMLYHLQAQITVTFPGATGAPITPAQGASAVSLKQWPINRCVKTVNHTIDGASESYNLRQILPFVSLDATTAKAVSGFMNLAPDLMQPFTGLAVAAGVNSVFADQFAGPAGEGVYLPRTVGITLNAAPGNTTAVYNLDLWEPVITPFTSLQPEAGGVEWGVNSEQISIQLDFSDILAIDYTAVAGATGATYVVDNVRTFDIIQRIISAPVGFQIPQTSIYETNRYTLFSNATAIGAGAGSTASLTIEGSPIANKIYLGATYNESTRSAGAPEDFLRVSQLQVQFMGSGTSLTTYSESPYHLYLMSRRNGCILDYSEWARARQSRAVLATAAARGMGGLLICNPSLDFNISDQSCNGANERYVIQVTAAFDGGLDTAYPPVGTANPANHYLQALVVNKLLLKRVGTSFTTELLSISAERRAMAGSVPMKYSDFKAEQTGDGLYLSGGSIKSFFKGIGHGLSTAAHAVGHALSQGARAAWDHRGDIVNVAKQAAKYAPLVLAAGDDEEDSGGYAKRRRHHGPIVPY